MQYIVGLDDDDDDDDDDDALLFLYLLVSSIAAVEDARRSPFRMSPMSIRTAVSDDDDAEDPAGIRDDARAVVPVTVSLPTSPVRRFNASLFACVSLL